MTRKSIPQKSEKSRPAYRYQPAKGEKTLKGKPVLDPPLGRGFVELNGKRHYIEAPYGSAEGWGKYWDLIRQWENNSRKPFPTHVKTGILVEELAIKYLRYMESRYCAGSVEHVRIAMQFLIDHCGNLSTDEFSRHTLKKLQEILEERGVNRRDAEQRAERGIAAAPPGRLTINRYINFIKNAFIEGEERGWGVDENLPGKLAKVRPLRIGHTTAKEHESRDVVEIEDVKRTLPFMRPMIRAMVIIHFRSHMRSQDVCRLRLSDIEMNDPDYPDLWFYAPYEHKTKGRGKDLMKALPPEAQAALKPYAEARKDQPDAFIFSPKDNVKEHRETLRKNRKTSVQPSQRTRAQQAKKRKQKFPPKEQYTERLTCPILDGQYFPIILIPIRRYSHATKSQR
jgi:integrase